MQRSFMGSRADSTSPKNKGIINSRSFENLIGQKDRQMRLSGTFGGQQELFEANNNQNQERNITESETNRFTLKDAENESLRTSEND